MSFERIVHTECACLENYDSLDDRCLKRTFFVCDIKNSTYKYISVCNEFLRLKLKQENPSSYSYSYFKIDNVLVDIFRNYMYVPEFKNQYGGGNDIINSYITYNVCERPSIYRYIPIMDAIEMVLNSRNYLLDEPLFNNISYYLERVTYKKYKTKYADCKRLMNKIKRSYNEERENLITELFIKIYELNIKNYETS